MSISATDPPPLRGWPLILVATAINLGVFAEVLDLSIVQVAVPAIAGSLGASQTEATWTISAYAVAAAIIQPVTGSLTERYGEVRIFITSSLFFTLASVMCGLAPNIELLVLFRVLQGVAGAPLVSLSQVLILKSFPPQQKNLAQALWGMTALVGPVFGPIVGGWLTDAYSWRWAFFINVPVGIFCVVVLWLLMRKRDSPTVRVPWDVTGAAMLAIGIGSVQFMFDHGQQEDWFDSQLIVLLAVAAAFSLTMFAVWTFYEKNPIVNFSLFRKLTYSVPVAVIAIGYGAQFGIIVIYPLWLQSTLSYTATQAGLASASLGAAAIISAVLMGLFGNRLPLRTVASASFLLFAAGAIWLALMPADASFWQLSAPRILHGIAVPMFFLTLSDIMYTGIPPSKLAAAASVATFVRTMFLSLSTALSVAVWDRRSDIHHILLAEGVNPRRSDAMNSLVRQGFGVLSGSDPSSQTLSLVEYLTQMQARTLAFNDLCWMSAAVFLLIIPFIWLPKPPFGSSGGGMH